MKFLAFLLNIGWLILVVAMSILEGVPRDEDFFLVAFIAITLLINIRALYSLTSSNENWVSLFFKRKALEERRKIEKIKNDL